MNNTDPTITLEGFNGSNPLAFLAALGVLHLLSRKRDQGHGMTPKLAWCWQAGAPRPQIIATHVNTRSALVDELIETLRSDFRGGNKPHYLYGDIIATDPDTFRSHFSAAIQSSNNRSSHAIDLLSGFASDAFIQDAGAQKGLVEPSIISFANRQSNRYLLDDYAALIAGLRTKSSNYPPLTSAKLHEALFETWRYSDAHKELRWDPSELRLAALPAQSTATVHGANALAFWALAVLSCAPGKVGLQTLGVRVTTNEHGRTERALVMPIWRGALSLDVIRSLLAHEALCTQFHANEDLTAWGIESVFVSRIITYQKANYFASSTPL